MKSCSAPQTSNSNKPFHDVRGPLCMAYTTNVVKGYKEAHILYQHILTWVGMWYHITSLVPHQLAPGVDH